MDQVFSTLEQNLVRASRTLNLDALRTFVAICETGTFRRAATRVHRSPSAVSLQITKLEELLNAKLMSRDARHVRLTEDGEILLSFARKMLGLNDEVIAAFKGSALTGHLRLAAPHDLGVSLVPGLLRGLSETHPGIIVDVRLDTSHAVQSLLDAGEANLALFNEATEPDFQVHRLYSEPLMWLMRKGGRAVEREPLPLAISEVGCAWREAALSALQTAERDYRIAYSSDTSMGQVAALRGDLAIAALPRSLVSQELVEVPADYGLPALPETNVYLADDGSQTAKAFVSIVLASAFQIKELV
ncbi:HTH-type transcriptional regulator CysL [Pseudovibrio axinellae]|uniref:HTH-type transcriptional regulator CysL n=1 Tax=Pseudovibrio axinellae TaxID=989403 RepID=A0A165ZPY3_9HYPH|nr:LysR substrate-binding domain-containing protein [Pseudovibrio axinellae]KZL20133.1 HTH-type transcriptional regulator CysL [Pseudovibrio axinellae]SEQ23936.1 DNA-binding transcriptional regulator, LysR family [Pseudovibrio axinellae]